jgi:hypothetical protein
MRTDLVRVICLVVLFAVDAPAAHAWIGGGWLERLSGPGPFTGVVIDYRVLCLAAPSPDQEKEIAGTLTGNRAADMVTFPLGQRGTRAWLTVLGCHFLPPDEPRVEIGIQYSRLVADAKNNLLDYSHRPEAAGLDREVRLGIFLATADLRVNRVLDIGAALGRATFSSPSGLFPDLQKWVFQPLRLTTRPLAAMTRNRRLAGLAMIRLDGMRLNGGVRDEELGARPETFREPGEIVWTYSFIVDVSSLFWK